MKRLVFAAAALLLASGAFAKEATMVRERRDACAACMREWTPFAVTLAGPVGLPWGDWDVFGLQIGVFNRVYQFSGLQIGVVNVSDRARGFQLGVINVIATDDVPFLPILNWSF